jgi:3-hydroxybutyryl-CoA dehydrogenase
MLSEQKQSLKSEGGQIDVAVIGLGLMGRSIAACLLAAGHRVIGLTNDMAASRNVPHRVRALLAEMRREKLVSQHVSALMKQFQMTAQISDLSQCSIVFESVTEEVELKREIFHKVERVVSNSAIIATNTSAIPVTILQQGTINPQRILGIHWAEPAHITRFMEIIPGKDTTAEYIERIVQLAPSWGKEPSLLKREIRGFIANRISYAMFREACHLVDSGICTVEDVDRSLRNDVGWWMPFAGPFRYMDIMGVEGYFRVMKDLLPDLCTNSDVPLLMRREPAQQIRTGA